MSFNFLLLADRIAKGRIYPALARHEARPYTQAWREFGQHWPWTTPLRLQEYFTQHECTIEIQELGHCERPGFYPICIGFFDFDIDYIELLPHAVLDRVHNGSMILLFYYHEGDNPLHIKTRLDRLCTEHDLSPQCYIFVSSNSYAQHLDRFVWFADFELWYYQRNLSQAAVEIHTDPRPHEFTALVRIHKSWRAAVMADLHRNGILNQSIWSYCESAHEPTSDNPIELDRIPQLRWATDKFLHDAPYYADQLSNDQRNDHSVTVIEHHHNSYANIVLESQFDVDQSGGSFLTEKTFKPIKHGQLFFIAGGPGSLQQLRDLGYRTFDSVLDNRYDLERDPTERWLALRGAIQQAQAQGLHEIYTKCLPDIVHNQQLFLSSKQSRLNNLIERIYERCR
jgi:hypothetical protein